jgi:triacylglycerol lipase
MRVVLVHGILDTGKVFRSLSDALTERGAECLTPSLTPNDGRDGLEVLAGQLAGIVDSAWGPDAPIDLIGFSMGGLIARYYLQELGGHRRTRRFFAISAPFGGSLWSRLHWGFGVSQMRPGSPFLAQLEQSAALLEGMELHSYWTPFDLVIIPPTSSVWDRAENTRVLAPCHPCMLWSRTLREHIAARMGLGESAPRLERDAASIPRRPPGGP